MSERDRAGLVFPYRGIWPKIAPSAYIAPGAVIIGDVTIDEECSVWSGAVIRGDTAPIVIARGANIQDNATLHVDEGFPTHIGAYVVIGHNAIVHASIVHAECLIAMHATVLSRCEIGSGSIIAAKALVAEGSAIPSRSMVMGVPGKVRRAVDDAEAAGIRENADHYIALSREYLSSGMGNPALPEGVAHDR